MDKNNQATHLKKEILVKTIKAFLSDNFEENTRLIPFDMRPKGHDVPYRCCIYKEREILRNRIIATLGFPIEGSDERVLLSDYAKNAQLREKPDEQTLTVLESACKGCVPNRIFVTDLCQGCVARPCIENCKFGAISIVNGKSQIDSSKCKNCTKCIQVCPYHAIVKIVVPCENACPVDAISKDEQGHARIDFKKCITCGKCVSACPFGAIHEKSQIIDILTRIKQGKKVVAMIAPSVAGQLPCTIYQLKAALLKCGFYDVLEVAQGADITATNEAKEFDERIKEGQKFMTSSCCAGYNNLVDKHLNEIAQYRSDTKTPLYYTAQICREKYPDAISVFVSPCVAKKSEALKDNNIDYVMNYEELGALFVAHKIELSELEGVPFDVEASREGRNFGITGGVAKSVEAADNGKNEVRAHLVNGINKDSIRALKGFAKKGECEFGNLIEVMCCEGGCVGGNDCLSTVRTATKAINDFTKDSKPIV